MEAHLTPGEIQAALATIGSCPVADFTPWELGFVRACLLELQTDGELDTWRHEILRNIAAAREEIIEARVATGVTVWSHRHPRLLTPEQEVVQLEMDAVAGARLEDLDADELGLVGNVLHRWAEEGDVAISAASKLTEVAVSRDAVAQERERTGKTVWQERHPAKPKADPPERRS